MGAEELLLESGKSAELSAAFQCLSDCEVDGEPKYSPTLCREVGKLIVCRTYATPLMELCHLICAAQRLGSYEYFFWDCGPARAAQFQAYCQKNHTGAQSGLVLEATGLRIHGAQDTFCIQYSRMPLLCGLMEFLLSSIGYGEVDEIAKQLQATPYSRKSVSLLANELSKKLYAFLKVHLPSAQSQRKFRRLVEFCQEDITTIDDSMILDFWCQESTAQASLADFKTYESVFLSFVRLLQAYDGARDLDNLKKTRSIGYDGEAGEISPDLLSEALESADETYCALERLKSPPINQVKFLNKLELNELELFLKSGAIAFRLPLSLLRAQSFTPLQNRLTQALRRKADKQEIKAIISTDDIASYSENQIAFEKLSHHLETISHAAVQALIEARCLEVINVLMRLKPALDLSSLKPYLIPTDDQDGKALTLAPGKIAERFLNILSDPEQVGEELAALMLRSQNAYKGLSRKGFKEDLSEHPVLRTAFIEGSPLLIDILHDIQAYLERLDSLEITKSCWDNQFNSDRRVFAGQFETLYGAA